MSKIIVIPDSFKGTMTSSEICAIMRGAIMERFPSAEVVLLPVADGGEGTVDAFLAAAGGHRVELAVKDPYYNDINAVYGVLPDGTAVIELAAAAGLPLVGDNRNAAATTTFGVGQMIQHALELGARKLILGLGGSATNDGGAGLAAALGVAFYKADGEVFIPVGGTLCDIARIDASGVLPLVKMAEIVAMCDIDNPLCGVNGAAHVFAPQKGADAAMVALLDKGLAHLAHIMKRDLGKDVSLLPGAGAAGGAGAGVVAFLNAVLQPGIETVLNTVGFNAALQGASLVITGEGRIDAQSLRGKVVVGVARRAKAAGVPVVAVVGDIGDGIDALYDEGVSAIFSINQVAVLYGQAKIRAPQDLAHTMDNLLRLLALWQET